MKRATKNDTGVTSTATSVTSAFSENMNASVRTMVRAPVKNCWKAITRPFENCSASVTIRLTTSPRPRPSAKETGSSCSRLNACSRRSLTTQYATRFVTAVSAHCEADVAQNAIAIHASEPVNAAQPTSPGPTRASTARPVRTGSASVETTTATASAMAPARRARYGRSSDKTLLIATPPPNAHRTGGQAPHPPATRRSRGRAQTSPRAPRASPQR